MPGAVLAHRAEIAVGIDAADKAVPLLELAERKKAYVLLLKTRVGGVSSGKKA